jgi:hypothetical protein
MVYPPTIVMQVTLIVHLSRVFFCHKHGHSQFRLLQRRAEGSDPFLWAEGVPGVKMHRMLSVQYGKCHATTDSVNVARCSKMVAKALSMAKEPDASPHPLLMQTVHIVEIKL